jgi:hypothetical protein
MVYGLFVFYLILGISSITLLSILGLIYFHYYKLVTCLKLLIFHSSVFTTFIFLLIASVSGHLIYFSNIVDIIDCLNNTPHTQTINFLYLIHLDLALNLDLANRATKIGGHRLGVRDVTLDDTFTILEHDVLSHQHVSYLRGCFYVFSFYLYARGYFDGRP